MSHIQRVLWEIINIGVTKYQRSQHDQVGACGDDSGSLLWIIQWSWMAVRLLRKSLSAAERWPPPWMTQKHHLIKRLRHHWNTKEPVGRQVSFLLQLIHKTALNRGLCLIAELITNHWTDSLDSANENLAESKSVHAFKWGITPFFFFLIIITLPSFESQRQERLDWFRMI